MASSDPAPVNRKSRVGTVVSDRMEKTLVVAIGRTSRHPLYRKVIRRTKRYHVHDPEGRGTLGDLVRIEECRPVSRTKRWRLVEVLTERAVAEVAPTEIDRSLVEEIQRSPAGREPDAADGAAVPQDPPEASGGEAGDGEAGDGGAADGGEAGDGEAADGGEAGDGGAADGEAGDGGAADGGEAGDGEAGDGEAADGGEAGDGEAGDGGAADGGEAGDGEAGDGEAGDGEAPGGSAG